MQKLLSLRPIPAHTGREPNLGDGQNSPTNPLNNLLVCLDIKRINWETHVISNPCPISEIRMSVLSEMHSFPCDDLFYGSILVWGRGGLAVGPTRAIEMRGMGPPPLCLSPSPCLLLPPPPTHSSSSIVIKAPKSIASSIQFTATPAEE